MTNQMIERSRKRHGFANVAVIVTTMALMVSLVVAAITVSIGIARADTLTQIAGSGNGGRLAVAILLTLLIAGMGGLTAAMVNDGRTVPRRD